MLKAKLMYKLIHRENSFIKGVGKEDNKLGAILMGVVVLAGGGLLAVLYDTIVMIGKW